MNEVTLEQARKVVSWNVTHETFFIINWFSITEILMCFSYSICIQQKNLKSYHLPYLYQWIWLVFGIINTNKEFYAKTQNINANKCIRPIWEVTISVNPFPIK